MRRHQPYRHSGWPDRSTMMTMTLRRINRLTNKWSATVNITDAVGKSFLITFKTGFVCLSNEPILFSIFLLMSNDIKAINSDAGHSLSGYEPRTALLHNECIESDRRHPFALFHQHPSVFCCCCCCSYVKAIARQPFWSNVFMCFHKTKLRAAIVLAPHKNNHCIGMVNRHICMSFWICHDIK